jgi:hypothetical protein
LTIPTAPTAERILVQDDEEPIREIVASMLISSPGAQVTVTATLTDGTGTMCRTAFPHFQVANCGGNLPVTGGTSVILQDSFDLWPSLKHLVSALAAQKNQPLYGMSVTTSEESRKTKR